MSAVTPIRMPKWGLSMQEGKIVDWWKPEGSVVREGEDLVDIETAKINNVFESPAAGILRRIVAQPGETLPVGALIAVMADDAVGDAEVESFIVEFQASFTPESEDGGEQALKIESLDVGGRAIAVGRTGADAGTPVVLIHGFASDMNSWAFNIPALAAGHPVIAIDLPGHGASDKDVGDGSLASLADAVLGALRALGVDRAHLVGHSLGGAVAAWMAAEHPGLAASLTLISPAGLPGGTLNADFLRGVAEGQRAKDLKPLLEMLAADPALVSRDMVEDVVKYKRLDGVEEALTLIAERLVSGADLDELQMRLSSIPSAVVIASRKDAIVGAPDETSLPSGFDVIWMDDAGHIPQLEKAAAVDEILARQAAD